MTFHSLKTKNIHRYNPVPNSRGNKKGNTMNDKHLQVHFEVIGIFGAPRHTHSFGTYDCIREAQNRVDTWRDDSVDPIYKYSLTNFDEIRIVKHSQVTVHTSKGLGVQENNLPDSSSHTPAAAEPRKNRFEGLWDRTVDYERQGVVVDTTGVEELRDLLQHLEDRHVGLRHELLNDMEDLQDDVEEIRDDAASAAADIDNLDGAMRHEVAGLRREMESLRAELRQSGKSNNHEQWRRQQELDRLATEGSK